jgi:hypothetical protein
MSNNWQELYAELIDYIARHPEIKIWPNGTRIPDDVRPHFNRLFNTISKAFIEAEILPQLNEVQTLCNYYLEVEKQLITTLKIDEIVMESDLDGFLHGPIEQLSVILYNPLFDLLKGRMDIAQFKELSRDRLNIALKSFSQLGYEKWVVLSLVMLLEPDILLQVPLPRLTLSDFQRSGFSVKETIKAPEKSKRLLFRYPPNTSVLIPDLIIHSAKINKYIAVRSHVTRVFAPCFKVSSKREWQSFNSAEYLEDGMTMVYIDEKPEEISLIADATRICKPDFIIETKCEKDWYTLSELEKTRRRHDIFKPVLGTYVISLNTAEQQVEKEQMRDISMFNVGFSAAELNDMVEIISRKIHA